MHTYVKGHRYEEFTKPGANGAMFDIEGNGLASLFIFMPNISQDKLAIQSFNNLTTFEVAELYQNKIILLTLNTQFTGWCDMI